MEEPAVKPPGVAWALFWSVLTMLAWMSWASSWTNTYHGWEDPTASAFVMVVVVLSFAGPWVAIGALFRKPWIGLLAVGIVVAAGIAFVTLYC